MLIKKILFLTSYRSKSSLGKNLKKLNLELDYKTG